MRKKYVYCVRLVGTPANRRFILQRSDGRFWCGTGRWVAEQHRALVYRTVADAQAGCRAFAARQTRGQPRRQFTCTLIVKVVGDETTPVTAEAVASYLTKVLVVGIDYERQADGPLADRHVEVAVRLGEMREG